MFSFGSNLKKTYNVLFLALATVSIAPAIAQGNYYLGIQYGLSSGKLEGNNQAISYPTRFGSVTDTYPLDKATSSKGAIALKAGYEFASKQQLPAIAIGLGLYSTTAPYEFTGNVYEATTASIPEKLYNYQFKLNSTQLLLETKFIWNLPHHIMPYVELGFGSAFNNLSGYSETPVTASGYITQPGFRSKNTTDFAYQVGLGLAYAFSFKNFSAKSEAFQRERIAIGYRFANLGDASFATRSTDYPYALKMGELNTSEIYLNFTHLF